MNIAELLENFQRLIKARGSIAKTAILKELKDDEDFTNVLKFLLDPYNKTNLGMKKLQKIKHKVSPLPVATVNGLLTHLHSLDGTDESINKVHAIAGAMEHTHGEFASEFVFGLVTKTLKVGVTAKTANKVYGDKFIPIVGVMLANKYNERKDKVAAQFIVTEKLDGIRRIIFHDVMGRVKAYSRSGIEDVTIKEVLEAVALLPKGFAYDGELLAIGDFKDCIEQRQATNSLCSTSGTTAGVKFNIFDMIPLTDYLSDSSDKRAKIRKTWLAYVTGDYASIEAMWPNIDLLTILETCCKRFGATPELDYKVINSVPVLGLAYSEAEVYKYAESIWDKNFEGVMLNTLNGLYRVKRSDDILKVKKVDSVDLKIVDWIPGGIGTKYEKTCGALIVSYKGNDVGVGSGLSDALRHDIATNFSKYEGKIAEINTFGESRNANGTLSINAPIFVGIRHDKTEADY